MAACPAWTAGFLKLDLALPNRISQRWRGQHRFSSRDISVISSQVRDRAHLKAKPGFKAPSSDAARVRQSRAQQASPPRLSTVQLARGYKAFL